MITAVVSGSFKFKPEIDLAIDALEETGIHVLEPAKGWLLLPNSELIDRIHYGQLRPLPSEEKLLARQIEDRFLRALGRSSLMYIMNKEGYIGTSTAFEMGSAVALLKPLYAVEPLNFEALEIDDLALQQTLSEAVTVLPPELVAGHFSKDRILH
jgi:hypothetical protein